MGYRFGPEGLAIAYKTLNNFVERAILLYEQESGDLLRSTRLGFYTKRWLRCIRAGLYKAQRLCVMQNPALGRWLEVGEFIPTIYL